METRRSFMKKVLGCIGGFIGLSLTKAGNSFPIKTKYKGKVRIAYLSVLGGGANPLIVQHQDKTQALMMVLEAPFIIYWDGVHKKNSPMGNVEINLLEIGDERHLIRNLDVTKLTDWIIPQLAAIPESKRVRKYVVGEMAWEARLSIKALRFLQKDGK